MDSEAKKQARAACKERVVLGGIYGPQSFAFEVLEELERGEAQTPRDYANDLKALKGLWLEKEHPAGLY